MRKKFLNTKSCFSLVWTYQGGSELRAFSSKIQIFNCQVELRVSNRKFPENANNVFLENCRLLENFVL